MSSVPYYGLIDVSAVVTRTVKGSFTKKPKTAFLGKRPLPSRTDNRGNRGQSAWKNAQHIIIQDIVSKTELDEVLEMWRLITAADPEAPKSTQRLYIPIDVDNGVYRVFDRLGFMFAEGTLEDLISFGSIRREIVFVNLETRYKNWLECKNIGNEAYRQKMVVRLKAVTKPYDPLFRPVTGEWPGFYDHLFGHRPEADVEIYSVNGLSQLEKVFGELLRLAKDKDIASTSFVAQNVEECRDYLWAGPRDDHITCKDQGFLRNSLNNYGEFVKYLESFCVEGGMGMKGSLQEIHYGAPGTGKSKGINDESTKLPKEDVVRTTFHPDSDYSTFVGAYKPKMELVPRVAMDGTTVKKATYDAGIDADAKALLEVEKRISYEFVPQAFAKAYVQAWKRMATPGADGKIAPLMLVIEEINRGDCAKIFGDLFQLLDRRVKDDAADPLKKAGFSEYPVLADSDLADFIRRELTDAEKTAITNAGYGTVVAKEHLELMLPPNMYIWATMNTSDQSLFPMDSAFKRRWDWKYTPIKDEGKEWTIKLTLPAEGDAPQVVREYDWWKFLEKVNGIVEDVTSSEDKKLGYFFVKTTDGIVDADMLVNKVFFFLWNDVFKDVAGEACLQYDEGGKQKDIRFHKFFKPDGKLDVVFVNKFLSENLKVPAPAAMPGAAAGGEDAPAAEGAAVETEPAGEGE